MTTTQPIATARHARIAGRVPRAGDDFSLRVSFSPDQPGEQDLPLSPGETRIGRQPKGAPERVLALRDCRVSRLHATLTWRPERRELWLADSGSRNGVFVNAQRVEGCALRVGDVVRVGDTVLLLCRGGAAASEEAGLGIVGRAPIVCDLRTIIRRVGPSELPVVVVGPTGSGKELVARALHAESGRRGPFLALNCAALPGPLVENALFGHHKGAYTDAVSDQDGAFVQAHGGTLFLDEIGDLALEAQPKLLRALEQREVTPVGAASAVKIDVRIVIATHVPLDVAMREGRFREDLYARLAGVVVKTPPLAEHKEDLLLLLRRFVGAGARDRPMTADFVESLLSYGWPRNVRELEKLAERLPVLYPDAPAWTAAMLDDEMRVGARGDAVDDAAPPDRGPPSREELTALLDRCGGNVTRLARLVHRSRKQVYRWMRHHEVEPGTGRSSRARSGSQPS